jgi:hypothetical protein
MLHFQNYQKNKACAEIGGLMEDNSFSEKFEKA